MTRIGSLFSGVGGLDMGVQAALGGDVVWHSEVDWAASRVLAHHHPTVPNLGDITTIDWDSVPPVDVLCGGFPCQDVSLAASYRRQGLRTDNRSGLWAHMATAIEHLQPRWVIIENVRGLLSAKAHRNMECGDPNVGTLRAAGAVLGDLSDLGYDARWTTISANTVGAPHRRERVFITAHPPGCTLPTTNPPQLHPPFGGLLPTPTAGAGGNKSRGGNRKAELLLGGVAQALLPTPSASDGIGGGPNDPANRVAQNHQVQLIDLGIRPDMWGKYGAAIRYWEELTRPAPPPTERGNHGKPRLSAAFAEWMMGWPAGWITAIPDDQTTLFGDSTSALGRSDQLRLCGNGVVPQQATAAIIQLVRGAQWAATTT